MNPTAPQLLAGDTNVGMDLAEGDEWVVDAMSTIRRRLPGCSLLIPPTVSEELAWLALHGEKAEEREVARSFLRRHRTWGFELVPTVPLGNAFIERVADTLLQNQLLPASEVNDAHILAEAAALRCSILLTSDEHLRAVDFHRLSFGLNGFDLSTPIIATPREIVRKFFR